MRVDDMILVSIDDHVIEPPDMFERHIPARFRDRAPRIERRDDGIDRWVYLGTETGSVGLNAVASWPREEWSFDPVGFAEMRPGAYDSRQRVRDMDANGVLAVDVLPDLRRLQRHEPRTVGRSPIGSSPTSWSRPTTTGTSTNGRASTPAVSSRWRSASSSTSTRWSPRSAASRPRAAPRSACPRRPTASACRASSATTGTPCSPRSATRTSWSACTSAVPSASCSTPMARRPTTSSSSRRSCPR